jgi:hypothetical protein
LEEGGDHCEQKYIRKSFLEKLGIELGSEMTRQRRGNRN